MGVKSSVLYSALGAISIMGIVTSADAFALRQDRSQDMLSSYEKTGETLECIPLNRVRDTDVLDDYAMLVEISGGVMYLNEFEGRCPGLSRERRYVHRSPAGRMCKGDYINVFSSVGSVSAGCVLGAFERLEKIPGGK